MKCEYTKISFLVASVRKGGAGKNPITEEFSLRDNMLHKYPVTGMEIL